MRERQGGLRKEIYKREKEGSDKGTAFGNAICYNPNLHGFVSQCGASFVNDSFLLCHAVGPEWMRRSHSLKKM